MRKTDDFSEITVAGLHEGFASGDFTAQDVTAWHLDRIATVDRAGPTLNSVISVNELAMAQAAELDKTFRESGPVGPLHGVTVLLKDQIDTVECPTTLGSVLFRDNRPGRDSFVAAKLRAAGAILLGKTTLGELGAGDTHGSLFGSTRNVYDLDRTAGGSSGGSGAAVSANLCAVALGQEGYASIRRPATWNGVVGMRPSLGLVSRGGVYDGWPSIMGSVGPMCRTVEDAARVLDAIAGYDPVDPVTARGVGQAEGGFLAGLSADALKGARLGVLRTPMGDSVEPDAPDFARVAVVFDRALSALADAGAELVEIEIPGLLELLEQRTGHPTHTADAIEYYVSALPDAPYRSQAEMMASADYAKVTRNVSRRFARTSTMESYGRYLAARDLLKTRMLDVMARHRLDAITHKAIEHEPTLIRDGVNPPFVNHKGAPHINTFLGDVPSVVAPAGLTSAGLPAGLCFLGKSYDDRRMLSFAHAFEQATMARVVPRFAVANAA